MNNLLGKRYIYHYHVFEHQVELLKEKNINSLLNELPILAYSNVDRINKEEEQLNFTKITENHDQITELPFYNEIMLHVNSGYIQKEMQYDQLVSIDSYTKFNSFFLAPIIMKKDDKFLMTFITLKMFNYGLFYLEIEDTLDNLTLQEDFFNILVPQGEGDCVYLPMIENQNIKYEKTVLTDEVIQFNTTDYYGKIVNIIEKLYKEKTFHSYYTLFMLDNNIFDKKIDGVNINKIVNGPIFPNLGIDFSNNTNYFQWNHFKLSGSIDRLMVELKPSHSNYDVDKSTYIENKEYYRGINNAFIMASLNHIYMRKTIYSFLSEMIYSNKIAHNDRHKGWINYLETNAIQGDNLKYLPLHNLKREIENKLVDESEYESIQKLHTSSLTAAIEKQQKYVQSKLNFLNILAVIFAIITVPQLINIFTDDSKIIIIISFIILILLILVYVIYSICVSKSLSHKK